MKPIRRVEKGKQPTLMHADKANELIDALNTLFRVEVIPLGSGKWIVQKNKIVLHLKPGTATAVHPFQVRLTTGDPGSVSLHPDSRLADHETLDPISVTDLDATFQFHEAGERLWLDIAIDEDGAVTGATIEIGDEWDGYPYVAKFESEVQTHAFVLIAHSVTFDDAFPDRVAFTLSNGTRLQVVQDVCTHIGLELRDVDGLPALWPVPFFGPLPP